MRARRGFLVLGASCVWMLCGCGDDDGPGPPVNTGDSGPDGRDGGDSGRGGGSGGSRSDGGPRAGTGGDGGSAGEDTAGTTGGGAGFDAAGDYHDSGLIDNGNLGPVPEDWSCPDDLWVDGICDCGCGARDGDCLMSSCSDPGCKEDGCLACFAVGGEWMSCLPPPSASDWTCDPTKMADAICDCGCGIPDPACNGAGCTSPACRAAGCSFRNGCNPGVSTDASDDCSSNNPGVLSTWTCAPESYGGADGCDCGCGVLDPDCGCDITADPNCGCTDGRCFDDACTTCHDEAGRPYACAAAEAGWDQDTTDGTPASLDVSKCSSLHFDAADGCDCGCGGLDPDCGSAGCSSFGCDDAACERCTDGFGNVIGCADPTAAGAWDVNSCDLDSYGMGDGCDCGCGAPDPDCDGKGSVNDAFTADCDFCHDGVGGYDACPGWDSDCADALVANGECDCGCGLVDPDCRVEQRASCTSPGCEVTTCEFCNDNGTRDTCGGEWASDLVESACAIPTFDLDGLCDCGCGVADPDCDDGEGCTGKGCSAPGCDVCHDGYLLTQCLTWYCPSEHFGKDDGCDCGCNAPDPDCDGAGCTTVGCDDAACDACHDPFGRITPCP